MNKVVVIGSLNIDIVQKLERLPKQGETLSLKGKSSNFGGKGANQAVASARQDAQTAFVGAVGNDAQGTSYIALLKEEKINTNNISIKTDDSISTGTAYIMLEDDGHNTILVYGGANKELTAEDVKNAEDVLKTADVVVAQLEVPEEAILQGFKIAHDNNAITILNPAPVTDHINPEILELTDLLIPNETEAASLIHQPAVTDLDTLKKYAHIYKEQLHVNNLIITLGSDGSFYSIDEKVGTVPSFKVKAVDTTAAGDTFIGTIAANITKDMSNIEDIIARSSFASSIVVSRPGAIPAIPTDKEIEDGLKANG